ncbi:MAG: SusC/RagA family TonB-linked outer membrane protein, partial [Bacteroidales bacterium]|nr:SusC/RagA family TonB-linked outer membrane protein [Bacteroidales bacterium]
MKKLLMILLFSAFALVLVFAQGVTISGTITDENGDPLPGATVQVKETFQGAIADLDGNYSLEVNNTSDILVFSSIGYSTVEIPVLDKTTIDVSLEVELLGLDEVVVVGYGVQKKSDVTGAVASLSRERLEMTPNLSIAQAIQGSIPGVMIHTNSAGTNPDQAIMVRGRNSITADNDPLIVVDGVPYGGSLSDINPNDVESIEVLKDASSAAIYGSRGANGVILVTTKQGEVGKITINYDLKTSIQQITKVADYLTPDEYFDYKIERNEQRMTDSEREVHANGTGVDWIDLGSRQGQRKEHNLSISGGSERTKFYIGGGLADIQGVALNDDYMRLSNRINIETKITDWLTMGTRTNLSYEDESGTEADFEDCLEKNPLTTAYDENGQLTVWPWPEQLVVSNALQETLYDDKDLSYQMVSNNYALISVPYVEGLTYRLNTGIRMRTSDKAQYRGTDTESGLPAGKADLSSSLSTNTVIENIVNYNREFGNHSIFVTAVYGYEGSKSTGFELDGEVFPNDFLSYHSIASAVIKEPSTSFRETSLISQMARLNYSYSSRYLLTMTVRRDGFSGFGAGNKWGVFPSVAVGWNLANEDFFPLKDMVNELKLRASMGTNGNQAIGAYESISRLVPANIASGPSTRIGYKPAELGNAELGWESSRTINLGMDIGILKNRITANVNYYLTNTFDLLLDRSISSVHGVTPVTHLDATGLGYGKGWRQTAITENIGETQNTGVELFINSRNIVGSKFSWSTTANFSF